MAKITIDIDTSNEAFDVDPMGELARILRKLADDVLARGTDDRLALRDVNGNTVGTLRELAPWETGS